MNVKQEAVTNAANLSFFMVNFSSVLLRRYREHNPEFSVLDLKSHYRGCRYASETIKLLPQKPDGILLAEIFEQIARLGHQLQLKHINNLSRSRMDIVAEFG